MAGAILSLNISGSQPDMLSIRLIGLKVKIFDQLWGQSIFTHENTTFFQIQDVHPQPEENLNRPIKPIRR